MKEVMKAMLQLFSGWVILLHFVFYTGVIAGYMYLLSKDPMLSIVVGAVLAVPSLYFISFLNRKAKRENEVINDLNEYSTTLTFQLQTGQNVATALRITKDLLSSDLQKEIDRTLKKKEKTALLDTEHFKKYKFPALNAFHANLKIIDEKGGNAREIFDRANKLIDNAIADRDLQIKKKNATANIVYLMFVIVASIPMFLRFFVPGQYKQYIELPISTFALSAFVTSIMVVIFLVTKRKTKNEMPM